jgi:hypothetical protein
MVTMTTPEAGRIEAVQELTELQPVGPEIQALPEVQPPWFMMSGFGPVQEVTLSGLGDDSAHFFDLDTGLTPAEGPAAGSSPEEEASWRRDHGIDLVADTTRTPEALIGYNLVAIPVNNDEWDVTAPRLADLLLGTSPRTSAVMQAAPNASPATYVFQTREGSFGVLQITGADRQASPPTITLRYKLGQGQHS